MGIQSIGGDGDHAFGPAILVQGYAFCIFGHEQLIVDAFGRDEHQRNVQSSFAGENVFLRNTLRVAPHRLQETFPGFFPAGSKFPVIIQRKFGVNWQELVLETDDGVYNLPRGEAMLNLKICSREGICEKSFQSYLPETTARLRPSQYGL